MDAVRFGLSIRALRRRRRWRQLDLAEQAGVSRTAISRVERGRADRLTVRALQAVAGALGPGSTAGCCGTARRSTDSWTSHMPPWSTSSFGGWGPRAGTPRRKSRSRSRRTWIDRRARVSPDGRDAACRRGEVGASGSAGDAYDARPQDAPGVRDCTGAGMAGGARRAAPSAAGGPDCAAAGRDPRGDVRRRIPGTRMGGSEMASRSRSRCGRAVTPGRPTPAGPPTSRGDLAAFSGLIFLSGAPRRALVIASPFTRRGAARRTRQVAAWSTPDDIVMTNARVVDAWQKPAERSTQRRTVDAATNRRPRRRRRRS